MDEDVAFAQDIRPLFTNRDVSSMSRFFDLSCPMTTYAPTPSTSTGASPTAPCPATDHGRRTTSSAFGTWIDNGFAPVGAMARTPAWSVAAGSGNPKNERRPLGYVGRNRRNSHERLTRPHSCHPPALRPAVRGCARKEPRPPSPSGT